MDNVRTAIRLKLELGMLAQTLTESAYPGESITAWLDRIRQVCVIPLETLNPEATVNVIGQIRDEMKSLGLIYAKNWHVLLRVIIPVSMASVGKLGGVKCELDDARAVIRIIDNILNELTTIDLVNMDEDTIAEAFIALPKDAPARHLARLLDIGYITNALGDGPDLKTIGDDIAEQLNATLANIDINIK